MSGQFPTSPVAKSAKVGSAQNTIVSVTTSGRVQARQIDGQKFTTCEIDGMATSTSDILKAGDYFRFSGQDKVYMCVEDLDSDGSGEGTLTFEPPLRSDVANDIALVYDNVDFTVRLSNDIQEYSIVTNDLYKYQIDLIENL